MILNHKILILVNSSNFSNGIIDILEKKEVQVIGKAYHWNELLEILNKAIPDIILIDLSQYNESCIGPLKKLRTYFSQLPILLIINEKYFNLFKDFILIGINGLVYSDTTPEGLVKAIDSVVNGQVYFPNSILNIFKETLQWHDGSSLLEVNQNILSARESAVCKLFCNGLTYKEIAVILFISPRTVETHKKNILAKLKVKSTADIIKYAINHQLI